MFKHIGAILKNILYALVLTDKLKCPKCKHVMDMTEEYLYLLPIHFGDEHEESAAYYIKNGRQIRDESEIPTGQRAFYLRVFRCGQCGEKRVCTWDFLKVREESVFKTGGNYAYEEFADFIQRTQFAG